MSKTPSLVKVFLGILFLAIIILGFRYFQGNQQTGSPTLKSSEVKLLTNTINTVIEVDCGGFEVDPGSNSYCNVTNIELLEVEPSLELLFATGNFTLKNGETFWWSAVKREAFWGEILFENEDRTPSACDDISSDYPPTIFNNKFKLCGKDGQIIDRTSQ